MYRISKRFSFSASHQLTHLPDDHPCHRLHGHNYEVEVQLEAAELDERGFVYDYRDLDRIAQYLNEKMDHRHLNDVLGGSVKTTAENLAAHLHVIVTATVSDERVRVAAVMVKETGKTRAEFRP